MNQNNVSALPTNQSAPISPTQSCATNFQAVRNFLPRGKNRNVKAVAIERRKADYKLLDYLM